MNALEKALATRDCGRDGPIQDYLENVGIADFVTHVEEIRSNAAMTQPASALIERMQAVINEAKGGGHVRA